MLTIALDNEMMLCAPHMLKLERVQAGTNFTVASTSQAVVFSSAVRLVASSALRAV